MEPSLLKKPALAAVAVVAVLWTLSIGYAAFSGYVAIKPGTPFSVKSWNIVTNDITDHEARITSLASQMAALASEKKEPATSKNPQDRTPWTDYQPKQTYRTACGYSSGTRYDNCCRISVSDGGVVCKYSYNMGYEWNKFPYDPFPSTTKGDYSVSVMNDDSNNYTVCRTDNSSGTVECVYSGDMTRPWLKLPHNPF